jgi:hypothetical protein
MDYVSLMITTIIHFRDKLFSPIFLGLNYEKGFFFLPFCDVVSVAIIHKRRN